MIYLLILPPQHRTKLHAQLFILQNQFFHPKQALHADLSIVYRRSGLHGATLNWSVYYPNLVYNYPDPLSRLKVVRDRSNPPARLRRCPPCMLFKPPVWFK